MVTFTLGFGVTEDDVIQVAGFGWSQKLSPADHDEAVAMATQAMERALHFLLSGFDLDAI